MRRSTYFSSEQSFLNKESKVSCSNEIKQSREAIGGKISKVNDPFDSSEVSSTDRISSLLNEYTLKIGNSPSTGGVRPMCSSRGVQGFFRRRTPQLHDVDNEGVQYPIYTDDKKYTSSHAPCGKISQDHVGQQQKGGPSEFLKKPISHPFASVLDEISEINSPLGCLDSSLTPSEASFFSPPQTFIESAFSMGLQDESVHDDDPIFYRKPPGSTPKVKKRSKSQNHLRTVPVGMRKAPLPTRSQQNLKAPTRQKLPVSYQEWVEGIVDIATHVWMPLGFFAFQGVDSEPLTDVMKGDMVESTKTVHDSEKAKGFVSLIWGFYSHAIPEETYTYTEITWISNGLWQLLFNTVLYCLSLLDLNRSSAHKMENDSRMGAHSPGQLPLLVPAPLSWAKATSPSQLDSSKGSRDNIGWLKKENPPLSSGWSLGSHKTPSVGPKVQPSLTQDFYTDDPIHDSLSTPDLYTIDESYSGRLRVPLSVLDWCLLLRSLAHMGYTRDEFYIQTPTQASPHELLLVMLWLTNKFQLISAVEYVEINRQYPFLLRYHATKRDNEDSVFQDTTSSMSQERLLFSFSKSTVWPPASFDESATIAHRLRQIERILGVERSETRSPSFVAPQRRHCAGGVGKTVLRRVLAAQNLIQLSLNRLESALQQRNEQVSALGLHSYSDAQLCTYEHHNLYVRVIEGLYHLSTMEKRVLQRSQSLSAAGFLLAFLIKQRNLPTHTSDLDIVESLEGDAMTWLADENGNQQDGLEGHDTTTTMSAFVRCSEAVKKDQIRRAASCQVCVDGEGGQNTELLSHTISQFRAGRVREHLGNLWKSAVRRAKISAFPGVSVSDSISYDSSTVLLSDEAKDRIELYVKHHINRHYSLHATLAAELLILQYQHHQNIRSLHDINTVGDSSKSRNEASGLSLNASWVSAIPLFFTTTTYKLPVDSNGEAVSTGKDTPLGDCDIQLVEIGEPRPGATTSATVELERISRILEEIIQNFKRQQSSQIDYCGESLNQLRLYFNLRMLTKVAQG
ncbi:unnamed protein product [Phytomonas sp. Hart1]|nr:unnamed protein product [Phytomonas sp. Hart1]|eukprot:CCW70291.1 unnamed protein product [Phytomonas sp. isolate Hart1]